MATYLQGVTDYIPQLQAFRPDFNFYNKALQMKQSKYDAAHKQLSNLYGSLLNSPMLREQNIETRDQFFKAIDQDIKRMSGVDLSLQQNVDGASDVFNQLLDDKDIVLDMVQTKNYYKQVDRSQGFKNCADIEKCGGGWWEGGDRDLEYWKQDFQKASAEDARRMRRAEYTPYQDISKRTMELAKEYGDVSSVSYQGGYIIKQTNGQINLQKPLKELFMGSVAKDPKVLEYYKTKARVERKDWISSNIDVYGSEDEAQAAYYNTVSSEMNKMLEKESDKATDLADSTEKQKKELEKKIENDGTTPTSDLAQAYRDLVDRTEKFSETAGVLKEGHNQSELARRNGYNKNSMQSLDRALAVLSLDEDLTRSSVLLAERGKDFDIQVDQYSLESVKQANRLKTIETQAYYDMIQSQFESDLETGVKNILATGPTSSNKASYITAVEGWENMSDEERVTAVTEHWEEQKDEMEGGVGGAEKELSETFLNYTIDAVNEKNNAAALDDLINMFDTYLNTDNTGSTDLAGSVGVAAEDPKKRGRKEYWNTLSAKKKRALVSSKKGQSMLKEGLASLPTHQYDQVFDAVVKPALSNDPAVKETRSYLKELKDDASTTGKLYQIELYSAYLDAMAKEQVNQVPTITDKMLATGNEDDAMLANLFKIAIDHKGLVPKSNQEIINAYMQGEKEAWANSDSNENKFDPLVIANVYEPSGEYTVDREAVIWRDAVDPKYQNLNNGDLVKHVVREASAGRNPFSYANVSDEDVPGIIQNIQEHAENPNKDAYGFVTRELGITELSHGWEDMVPFASMGDAWDIATGETYKKLKGREGQDLIAAKWAKAFGTHFDAAGAGEAIGLSGFDSKGTMAAHYATMDPAEFLSESTKGLNGFYRDVGNQDKEHIRIAIDGFGELPDETPAKDRAVFDFLQQSLLNYTDPKKDRPSGSITYQNIAGGSTDWVGLNFKPNAAFIKKHTGSENNPGILWGYGDKLTQKGITTYIKGDNANNPFTNGYKMSIENQMVQQGLPVPLKTMFADVQNSNNPLEIKYNPSTKYLEVLGQIETGTNSDGTPVYESLPAQWKKIPVATDISDLIANGSPLHNLLHAMEYQKNLRADQMEKIKNPKQLVQ